MCRLLDGGEQLRCVERAAAAAHDQDARAARAMEAAAERLLLASPELQLAIAYEDDHMAAVVKPQGVPCDQPPGRAHQPAAKSRSGAGSAAASQAAGSAVGGDGDSGSRNDTNGRGSTGQQAQGPPPPSVYTLLAHTLTPSRAAGALRRPRHVHRLDEPTGGLLLVAKSQRAQQELGAAFEQRRVRAAGSFDVLPAAAAWWPQPAGSPPRVPALPASRMLAPSHPTPPVHPERGRSPSATARWPGAACRAAAW